MVDLKRPSSLIHLLTCYFIHISQKLKSEFYIHICDLISHYHIFGSKNHILCDLMSLYHNPCVKLAALMKAVISKIFKNFCLMHFNIIVYNYMGCST